ncbi:TcaA second domain-containing protein [Staphylococcus epidermidis]
MEKLNNNKKKKKILITSVILILIILLVIAILLFYQNNSSISDINKFDNAVKDKDYKTLSYLLSDNETNISRSEAKHFVEYVSKGENQAKYQNELEEIKKSIKKKSATKKGAITDRNKKPIIEVKQDGKKWFVLDKVDFKANKHNVYVKEYNNKAIYNYKLDKSKKIVAEPNQYTNIGSFFVGNYKLNATKIIKGTGNNGKLFGNLSFNTDNKDKKGKIIANDNFNQSWFKANLSNAEELDDNSIKLYINDNVVEYKKGMIYGKLSNQSKVEVHAEGSIYNKTFKTNTVLVDRNKKMNAQEVQLKFNKKEISKHINSYKNIENKSKEFINKYVRDLNKSYRKSDHIYIEDYFDKETKIYNEAKNDIKDKNNKQRVYRNGKINNINIDKENVVMDVNTYVNGNSITIRYTLDLGYKNKYFRIKEIKQQ